MTGQGTQRDYFEALRWFTAAAEQGNAAAQSNVGDMYQRGLGAPLDYVETCKWYRLAEAQGDQLATEARESLASIVTKQQVSAVDGRLTLSESQHPSQQKLGAGR